MAAMTTEKILASLATSQGDGWLVDDEGTRFKVDGNKFKTKNSEGGWTYFGPEDDGYESILNALYKVNVETVEVPVREVSPDLLTPASSKEDFKDLKTQARIDAQKKEAAQDFGVMAGLNLASLVFDAFPPKYIREKRKEAKEGVDEKEIAGKVKELTDKTTRTTRAASRETQRGKRLKVV